MRNQIRLNVAAVAFWLGGGPAGALTPPPPDGSSPVVMCYFTSSVVYGVAKCDPLSTLVGAVFGSCNAEEEAIRRRIMSRPGGDVQNRNVADVAIREIREQLGPRIQAWILDAQITNNPLCKAPNK